MSAMRLPTQRPVAGMGVTAAVQLALDAPQLPAVGIRATTGLREDTRVTTSKHHMRAIARAVTATPSSTSAA